MKIEEECMRSSEVYEAVATRVLKWHIKEFPYSEHNLNPVPFWVNEQGNKVVERYKWNPQKNTEHAFQLIRYLSDNGYLLTLEQTEEKNRKPWTCSFVKDGVSYTRSHNDKKVAICYAAFEIAMRTGVPNV